MNKPSIKNDRPDRKDLGPTGPSKMPADHRKASYEEKHPNPGNAGQDEPCPPIDPHPEKHGK